jgi:hypothetical protein
MATYLLNRPNTPEHLNFHQNVCENLTAHTRSSQKLVAVAVAVAVAVVVVVVVVVVISITKLEIYAI